MSHSASETSNYTNFQQFHVPEVDTMLSSDMPQYNDHAVKVLKHRSSNDNNSAHGGHQQTSFFESTSVIAPIPTDYHARPAYSSSSTPSSYLTSPTSASYPSTSDQAPWTPSLHSSRQNTHALISSYPSSPSYTSPDYFSSEFPHQDAHSPHSSGAFRTSSSAHTFDPGPTEMLSSYSTGSMPLSSPRRTPPTDAGCHHSSGGEEESSSLISQNTLSSTENQRVRQLSDHSKQLELFEDALALPFTLSAGPFIPQLMYKPHIKLDRRRYVEEVNLDEPIYFWMENPSECGIPLSDALRSRVKRLLNRYESVFIGRSASVSIRLEWPGYRQWSRQIPTRDFGTPPRPITKAKLAKSVAKCVQRFILERQNHAREDAETDACWRVGSGTTPDYITLDDLVLVSIHHVSMGSWQPQLRLNRPLPGTNTTLSADMRPDPLAYTVEATVNTPELELLVSHKPEAQPSRARKAGKSKEVEDRIESTQAGER